MTLQFESGSVERIAALGTRVVVERISIVCRAFVRCSSCMSYAAFNPRGRIEPVF